MEALIIGLINAAILIFVLIKLGNIDRNTKTTAQIMAIINLDKIDDFTESTDESTEHAAKKVLENVRNLW